MKVPEVSVIIPLYNAEKYIAECLDSLLAQTFQNFEVIVVDDCSTDSSCAIIESYASKFDGRLTLTHMEHNTGSGGLPRNKGIMLSRGEYIQFVDADDMLIPTALEENFMLAKDYEVDVIYHSKYYSDMDANGSFSGIVINTPKPPDEVLLDEDLPGRVSDIINGTYWLGPWRSFVRRTLLIEHEIFFPHVKLIEDVIWSYGVFFNAKKFLHAPDPVYFYRLSDTSILRSERPPQEALTFWADTLIFGLKTIDRFMSKIEFFQQNPQRRYDMLEFFVHKKVFNKLFPHSTKISSSVFYDTIKQNFGDRLGEYDVLIPALCTFANVMQKNYRRTSHKLKIETEQAQTRIAELEAELKRLKSNSRKD